MFEHYGELKPVHPDVMDMIPKSNVFKLVHTDTKNMLRRVGEDQLETSENIAKRAKQKVFDAIIMRLSPDRRQEKSDKSARKPKKVNIKGKASFKMTKSLKFLQWFFINEYMVLGEQGLPVVVKDGKQHLSDEDFERMVMKKYTAKPANYETIFPENLRVTATGKRVRSYKSALQIHTDFETSSSSDDNNQRPRRKRKRNEDKEHPPTKRVKFSDTESEDGIQIVNEIKPSTKPATRRPPRRLKRKATATVSRAPVNNSPPPSPKPKTKRRDKHRSLRGLYRTLKK